MKIKAFIRLAVTVILALNTFLVAKGLNPIPFDEATFTEVITYVASGVSLVWVWWKNNNVTKLAQKKQIEFEQEKEDGSERGESYAE